MRYIVKYPGLGKPDREDHMGDTPKAPEEASAAMRALARLCRDQFVALVAEGFTEAQALTILGHTIAAVIAGKQQ